VESDMSSRFNSRKNIRFCPVNLRQDIAIERSRKIDGLPDNTLLQ
jgi:hypothetical protein